MFFKEIFASLRGCSDNIVAAYVHMDETTPHMHTGNLRASMTRTRKGLLVTIKSSFHAKNIRLFTKIFLSTLKEVFLVVILAFMMIVRGKSV